MGTLKSGAKPVRTGKWQIMINGESYKRIVAEAAKLALGDDNIIERCFIVELLLDANVPIRSPAPLVSPCVKTKSTSSNARP
jgi:adenylylsulfate reductase subunit A